MPKLPQETDHERRERIKLIGDQISDAIKLDGDSPACRPGTKTGLAYSIAKYGRRAAVKIEA